MFLRDEDIKELIAAKAIENTADFTSDEDGNKSPIQPCSFDVSIGKIYVPGIAPEELGGINKPIKTHTLGPGETVIVETAEVFHLPPNIGSFGFPPTSVSNVGVLITNLGHVDPGYDGTIRFTLVNMGKKAYSLKVRDVIHTMLFFKLAAVPTKCFRERNPSISKDDGIQGINAELLSSLNTDFLNVDERAKSAATIAVNTKIPRWTLVGAIATALIAGFFSYSNFDSRLNSFDKKIEERLSSLDLANKVKELTEKVDKLAQEKSVDTKKAKD
jgi:dCTP deaminase